MARELKVHLLREADTVFEVGMALCGKKTENSTEDPETVSCKSCSGMYRTNMEWYSQVRNKAVESRGQSGEGDLYTRSDIEAGLGRLGWSPTMIAEVLDKTSLFRDVYIRTDVVDPWAVANEMGIRTNPGGIR